MPDAGISQSFAPLQTELVCRNQTRSQYPSLACPLPLSLYLCLFYCFLLSLSLYLCLSLPVSLSLSLPLPVSICLDVSVSTVLERGCWRKGCWREAAVGRLLGLPVVCLLLNSAPFCISCSFSLMQPEAAPTMNSYLMIVNSYLVVTPRHLAI